MDSEDNSGVVTFNPRLNTEFLESEQSPDRPGRSSYLTIDETESHTEQSNENDESAGNKEMRKYGEELTKQLRSISEEALRQISEVQNQARTQLSRQRDEFNSQVSELQRQMGNFSDKLAQMSQQSNRPVMVRSEQSGFNLNENQRNTNYFEQGDVTPNIRNSTPLGYPPPGGYGPTPTPMPRSREMEGNLKMRPQCYDGTEDWEEYLTQFEILAEINGWNYHAKSLYLAGSLKGGACALLSELNYNQQRDYAMLVRTLGNRYGSANRAEMFRAQLQTRARSKGETLPELAQSIKKLTRQAYPGAPSSVTDVLSLDHFIDALPDADMRLRLREARPRDITDAETLAVRLETHRLADSQRTGKSVRLAEQQTGSGRNDELKDTLEKFRQDLSSLTSQVRDLTQKSQVTNETVENQNNPPQPPTQPHYQSRNNGKFSKWRNRFNNGSRNWNSKNSTQQGGQAGNHWGPSLGPELGRDRQARCNSSG